MISHTDVVTRDVLNELVEFEGNPAISIVLGTSPTVTERGPIKISNALKQVQSELKNAGIRAGIIESELAELRKLETTPPFWSYQGESLVIYTAPGFLRLFRLPVKAEEIVVASKHFYLRPLFKMLQGNGLYYVLSLSQKNSVLYACTRDTISALHFEALPTMQETQRFLEDERQLQFHTDSAPSILSPATGSRREALFFGHGAGSEKENEKVRIAEHLRALDKVVCEVLANQQAPLVIAGAEFLHAIYKKESSYPNVLPSGVTGNFELGDERKLHTESWKIVRPIFEVDRENALHRYREIGDRELIVETLHPLLPAAEFGAIETLFIAEDASAWAHYDPGDIEVEIAKEPVYGFDELYDVAARSAFRNGGKVLILERDAMPAARPAAAILRFPYKAATIEASSRERGDYSSP